MENQLSISSMSNFSENINTIINNLLTNPEIIKIIDEKCMDQDSVNKLNSCMNSVKLLLDLLANISVSNTGISSSTCKSIVQVLRDICDLKEKIAEDSLSPQTKILNQLFNLVAVSNNDESIEYLVHFYLYNLHILKINLEHTDQIHLLLRLQIYSVFLENLCKYKNNVEFSCKFLQKVNEDDIPGAVTDEIFISTLIFHPNSAVTALVLLHILPNYLKYNDDTILQSIWEDIVKHLGLLFHDLDKIFIILCYLSDYLLTSSSVCLVVFEDEKYWTLLQNGLTNNNPMIRKQALYLMKKSIEVIFQNNFTIICKRKDALDNFDQKLNDGIIKMNGLKNFVINNNKIFLIHNDSKNYFWWDKEYKQELNQIYEELFLIIETLEEKQAHIVKPVLLKLNSLAKACTEGLKNSKNLHISWLILIYQRILKHDNLSIVKWGLINVFKININYYQNEETLNLILKLTIESLNNANFFIKNEEESIVYEEFKTYLNNCKESKMVKIFFKLLLKEICQLVWDPVPLFYVLHGLATMENVQFFGSEELLIIKHFAQTGIKNHYTFIKSAIQCELIQIIINFTDTTTDLSVIADVLSVFKTEESLKRGTTIYNNVVKWIEFCYSKKNAEIFILTHLEESNNYDEKSFAKMLIILHDANLFGIMKCCGESPSNNILNALYSLLSSFKNCEKRIYSNNNIQERNIKLLSNILQESRVFEKDFEKTRLVELMVSYFGDLLTYIHVKYKTSSTLAEYDMIQTYINVFHNVIQYSNTYQIKVQPIIRNIFNDVFNAWENNTNTNPVQKYFGMKIIEAVITLCYQNDNKSIPKLNKFQKLLKTEMNVMLEKSNHEEDLSRDLITLWGKMNSDYIYTKWRLLENFRIDNIYIISQNDRTINSFMDTSMILEFCKEALEIGSYTVLLPVMSVLYGVVWEAASKETAKLIELIDNCWKLVMELRKNEMFLPAVRQFIGMLYQIDYVGTFTPVLQQLLDRYVDVIFDTSINAVINEFVYHIQFTLVCISNDLLTKIISNALLYGPIMRRDERILCDTCYYINTLETKSTANELLHNVWHSSSEVRGHGLHLLFARNQNTDDYRQIVNILVDKLIEKDKDICKKTRYFGDSYVHRVKHRLLQGLLILQPAFSKDKSKYLLEWLYNSLLSENHQPSVRYMQEWLIVRIVCTYPVLEPTLWDSLSSANSKRTGSICSFISIIYHIIKVRNSQEMVDRAFREFLCYSMAQHFSVRLYAQVILHKLWLHSVENNFSTIIEKYEIISESLSRSINSGQGVKNAAKLEEDFYFTIFDPFIHHTLETIYTVLPRLANVASDEWVTLQIMEKCGLSESGYDGKLPIKLTDNNLKNFKLANWTLRSANQIQETEEFEVNNVQKKIIPWKSLVPDYEELSQFSINASKIENIHKEGLVVVASLVDKIPNLGGLVRTCQVFGASQFVIGSLKYLEDKQFQSLSVTAEKWIKITEVKPFYLKDYLISMKAEGYSIIGAEQASNSKLLNNINFPKKTLLILGNEKEGISADLLSLLDMCVEIPQLGVIRSLNVHVTGALFIWEYAKQHGFVGA